nr:alpha/beta hydrolase [Hasllibacter sp. MH4015]
MTIIVHGGYWMAFSGRDFAHLARGAFTRKQAVAMVTYRLAPEVSVPAITQDVARMVCEAAKRVNGPIRLVGHSAGGHLVTRMLCAGVLPNDIYARIAHVTSISGLHDLRPLMRTAMRDTLHLTGDIACTESPALLCPVQGARVTCVVGERERPEFIRQTALLANIWHGLGARMRDVRIDNAHHFNVIDGLEQPDSALMDLVLS